MLTLTTPHIPTNVDPCPTEPIDMLALIAQDAA